MKNRVEPFGAIKDTHVSMKRIALDNRLNRKEETEDVESSFKITKEFKSSCLHGVILVENDEHAATVNDKN